MDMCAPLSSVFCMKFACTHSRHIGYMKSFLLVAEPSCQDAEWIFFCASTPILSLNFLSQLCPQLPRTNCEGKTTLYFHPAPLLQFLNYLTLNDFSFFLFVTTEVVFIRLSCIFQGCNFIDNVKLYERINSKTLMLQKFQYQIFQISH